MGCIFYLKNRFRHYIFPTSQILTFVTPYVSIRPIRILDVGCGSGWFLRTLLQKAKPGSCGVGVEIDKRYYINQDNQTGISILSPENLVHQAPFDFIIFNDVLHHVSDKKSFILSYAEKLNDLGYIFIKDMSPDHYLCKFWNRVHDKLISGDSIDEISFNQIRNILTLRFEPLAYGEKRVFLYYHFWCLFRKVSQGNPI